MGPVTTITHTDAVVRLDTPLLTGDEVAELLRVPRTTVYDLSRRTHNPLPSIKVGRRKLFDRHAVEAWLGQQAAA